MRRQHATVHQLLGQGMALRAIARELGLSRTTVRRLAHAATPDELLVGQWTGRTSILDPYKPYLHQRWAEGRTNAAHLFGELQQHGYRGGVTIVREYVSPYSCECTTKYGDMCTTQATSVSRSMAWSRFLSR
ncbi:helix-turn-helix domain-containing protein [Streptomyces sp. CA-251387]|uniref:helix-turn-helix domain-containing protein n=1 Tax=Streptomyces sp. CA-251387 TaxID=3240064 RepID=UPI003D8E1291